MRRMRTHKRVRRHHLVSALKREKNRVPSALQKNIYCHDSFEAPFPHVKVRKTSGLLRKRFIMKLVRFSKLFNLRIIVCSLACLAGTFANAQVSHGTFNLPTETRWGIAVLPPGAYSYTLNSPSIRGIITVRSPGHTALITVTAGMSQCPDSTASYLRLVTQGGQTSIRELSLGGLGLSFGFAAPKVKYAILAQTPSLNQRLLVAEAR